MAHWYAVYTKPRQETLAEKNLERQRYEVYFPRLKRTRRYRRRWTEVIEPLFPRYLFAYLREGQDNFAPIRSTYGVVDIVRFGGVPRPVPEGLIEALQAHEDQTQKVHLDSWKWRPGMQVEILEGPFAGLKGIFAAERAEDRVVILLQLLGRTNRVTFPRDNVVPA